jgi:hypothetical protein
MLYGKFYPRVTGVSPCNTNLPLNGPNNTVQIRHIEGLIAAFITAAIIFVPT